MQLKKRFSVRKSVAAGAMAMAMFAVSMPAMAHGNGLGLNLGFRGRAQADVGLEGEIKAELKSIRAEMKQVAKPERGQGSVETEARKQCRVKARETHAARLGTARDERDAGLRKARTEYLAALKSARATFRLAIGLKADGTGTATVVAGSAAFEAARTSYQDAMRKAHEKFSSAKRSVQAEYHADVKVSKDALEAAVDTCK